jgi:adenosine kinase
MNLSAPFICQFFLDQLMEALPYVDYLFGNETEALALAKSLKLESENTTDIAMYVAKLPKHSCAKDARPERTVIITHGDLPTVVVTPTGIQTFPVEEIPTDELVDTNGAGDAFAGGFLSQLVQGKSLSASIQAGHYTAGVIIRRSGINFPPRPNMEFPDATTVSASS